MKRCPECRRDYYDDTLLYCLDDGTQLVDGPRSREAATEVFPVSATDETYSGHNGPGDLPTAILPSGISSSNSRRRKLLIGALFVALVAAAAGYVYFLSEDRKAELPNAAVSPAVTKVYWEMGEEEQIAFISERANHVQTLIGDEPEQLERAAVTAIKIHIDNYVADRDSLSQKPLEEGLRVIYGRATQFAPIVIRAFENQKVPPALGLYQAMIESEYHDCPDLYDHPDGTPVGLFQFSRRTAAQYGMKPADYCEVQKQCDAAARHMSDLISDFGSEKSSWTLALFSFNSGANQTRDYLRQLRGRGMTERSFWAVFRHQAELKEPLTHEASRYVPRFFAAAIIGETPGSFALLTPPLTQLRN